MADQDNLFEVSMNLLLSPSQAFTAVVEELVPALSASGIEFKEGPDGHLIQDNFTIAKVVEWIPGKLIVLEWKQVSWQPEEVSRIEIHFDPHEEGTRIKVAHHNWGRLIGSGRELAGWFSAEVLAPLLRTMAPSAVGDWITDRGARKPSGPDAKTIYGDPIYHYPNFRVILNELGLNESDYLLEIGCGGGVLLRDALKSGCRAAGIDHSADMVRLAKEINKDSINNGMLTIHHASADQLPFEDNTFTCMAMTGVLGFLSDPVVVFSEVRRVLSMGGRIVVLGSDPRLKGTPAAPEPFASRLKFFNDDEFAGIAKKAGFTQVRVILRSLEQYAHEAGVPEELIPLFSGDTAFLIAVK